VSPATHPDASPVSTFASDTFAGDDVTLRHASAQGWLWRRYARVYDTLEGVAGYREMVDAVLAATGSVTGCVVVEVGCGTGNVLSKLRQAGPARLIGIDSSSAMLAQARAKLGDGTTSDGVELHECDAVAGLSTLPAGSVDVLVASNVLYALPDRPAFWRAAARVLCDGGRVVVSNPDRPGIRPAIRQQWSCHGVAGFVDPRLIEVILINVAIDLLAAGRRYEFAPWTTLAAEADTAGLGRANLLGRCYGGATGGLNVVGVLKRR